VLAESAQCAQELKMARKHTTDASVAPVVEAQTEVAEAEATLASVDALLAGTTAPVAPWAFAIPQPKVANPWDFAVDAMQEAADDAEIAAQIALGNSKVKPLYKVRYKERARANGQKAKWAKRSTGDWMATQLAGEVLDKQSKIDIAALIRIAELNGIEDPLSRWPSQSKGWEGRLRMTIGLVLRPMVADAGFLVVQDENGETDQLEAPAEWVAKYRTK
jgi:hypothetical protein